MYRESVYFRAFMGCLALFVWCATGSGCATTGESSERFLIHDLSQLDVDDSTTDMLSVSDPVNPRDGASYRTYEINLEKDEVIGITAESGDMQPGITLFSSDGTLIGKTDASFTEGRSVLARRAPRAGAYFLVISGDSGGSYGSFHLQTQIINEAEALSLPATITHYLFDGLRTRPDSDAPVSVHSLKLEEATDVDILLESEDFDAYLLVVDAETKTVLAENDDWGESLNSRILMQLPAGDYEIWASAFQGSFDGRYSLSLNESEVTRSEVFELDQPYQGYLGGIRTTIPSSERSGQPLHFVIEESRRFDVTMRSHEIDSYLVLTDADGGYIAEDDDSGGEEDARLVTHLEPGEYILWATSYAEGEIGAFGLETGPKDLSQGASVSLESTTEGILEAGADIYPGRQTYVKYFILEVEDDVDVTIDLKSTAFDAYLVLEDSAGMLLSENDDAHPETTDAEITHSLSPGTYRIGVTTYAPGMFGEFILRIMRAAPSAQSV